MVARSTNEGYERLAASLSLLASPTRLELLHALRTPRALSEIRAHPSLSRGQENPDRPLSRQAITRHLERMMEAGLVLRIPSEDASTGDPFVINHERVFALVTQLRTVVRLRPHGDDLPPPGETLREAPDDAESLCERPRLVVAFGRDDGASFPLHGPPGRRWTLGRGPHCDVRLDYDAYASRENTVIEHTAEGFELVDLPESRNGTQVNGILVPRAKAQPLASGDLITVGRTVLAFQP